MGAALLVVGGAGMGAVLGRSLGVAPGRVGVACACRAGLAVPGLLRCRGTGGRWLPAHPAGAVSAVGGAGPCGGGGERVLAVCGTMALVGTAVRVGGGGGCACGTPDGVVRGGAPRGVGGLWESAAVGRGGDAAGGGRCSIGASGGRGRGGAGAW